MGRLSLTLLRTPAVRHGGQPVSFPTRKAMALLAYLAVEGGTQSREKITALFWPESDSSLGRSTLRRTLAYLNKALDDGHHLAQGGHRAHVRAERESLTFDLADSELDLRTIQATLAGAQHSLGPLTAAASLCAGEFLEGFSLSDCPEFDHWASVQREVWHRQAGRVFDRLSALQAKAEQLTAAVGMAARWVAHDALDEGAHRRLIELYAASGDRAAALVAYEVCRAAIERELGAEPSPETQFLARRVREQTALTTTEFRVLPEAEAPAASAPREAPLLGRGAEQERLVSAFRLARQGQLQVVTIEGEPGIGKTRLAREFMAWVATQGVTILSGRAFETEGRLAYQAILEALRGRLEVEEDPGRLLAETWWAELSRLLPEIKERLPHLPAPAVLSESESRTRLFEAVARLGQALSSTAPLVWFIDDLQWADASSLELLLYLTRRWTAASAPMLFVLTLRSEDVATSPALAAWLAALSRDVALARVPLGNLTLEDTRQLVWAVGLGGSDDDAELPSGFDAFSQQLFEETAGQPLFIVETLRSLAERGLLRRNAAGEWEAHLDREIPSGVKELIRGRLARLSPGAQALGAAGAVLGDGFEYGPVCQVADTTEGAALADYEELLAHGLLREAGRTGVFTHDRIREVLHDDLSSTRRRRLHGRALEALQERGAPPAALAHHALAAGLDERAFALSLEAGDEAMRLFAVRDAIQHYQTAEGLPRGGTALGETDLHHILAQLARAHELNADWSSASEVYERMLAAARRMARPAMESSALKGLATLAAQAPNFPRAEALLHQAQAVAEASGDRVGWAESEWALGQLCLFQLDNTASYAHGTRALGLARELNQAELIASCLNLLAYAGLGLGQLDGVLAHAREASERFAALGNRVLQADATTIVAHALMRDGHLADGIALARSVLTTCEELDTMWGQTSCLMHLICGLADQGEYGVALDLAQLEAAAAVNVPYLPYVIRAAVGAIHRELFDLEEAHSIHLALMEEGERHGLQGGLIALFAAELSADCVAAGQWDEALIYARQAAAARGYRGMHSGQSLWPETTALVRAGEIELAAANAALYGETIAHYRRNRVSYLRAQAVLAKARGDKEKANGHLRAALSLAEQIGLPAEAWQLHAALGEAEKARAIVEWLATKVGDERLARGFLARALGRVVTDQLNW